jgi:predicted phage baseplate assembly protein
VPRIQLLDKGADPWNPQRDLLASGPNAAEFVVEMGEDRVPWLRFGDDRLGRHPTVGETFEATWRVGSGAKGNLGAEALTRLVHETLSDAVLAVRNPMAASGGTDPEPLEQARLHAPAAFRVQERAVTEADWSEVCGRHPEVQRAVATIRWTGSWHTVFVTVDRVGGRPVDGVFVDEMLGFLEPYRLAGYDLEVDPPVLVPLDIAISVCVADGHFPEHVEEVLYQRFGTGVMPDSRKAFFHPDNHTFGGAVYLSQVIAAAMEVPGVAWVDARPDAPGVEHRFQRLHELPLEELREGVLPMGRLEIAQLDHDPNRPEAGRMRFYLRGGL